MFVLSALMLCLSLNACAQLGGGTREGGQANVTPGVTAKPAPSPITYEFPDIPLPVELQRVNDKTMIVRTPTFQGGVVTLRGRLTVDSLVDFFTKTLPKHGWELTGTLRAGRELLAFTKPAGSTCLIQVFESRMGLQTEVQIWITEPLPK